jgi:hypothetical protein
MSMMSIMRSRLRWYSRCRTCSHYRKQVVMVGVVVVSSSDPASPPLFDEVDLAAVVQLPSFGVIGWAESQSRSERKV